MSVSFGHLLLQYTHENVSVPLCRRYTVASSYFCAVQGMDVRSNVAVKQLPLQHGPIKFFSYVGAVGQVVFPSHE